MRRLSRRIFIILVSATGIVLVFGWLLWGFFMAADNLLVEPPVIHHQPHPIKEPTYLEDFCVTEQESQAFTVLVLNVTVPGAFSKYYRFPVRKESYKLPEDPFQPVEIPGCPMSSSSEIADNPFEGTGYGAAVNGYASDKGVNVGIYLYWTTQETLGSVDSEVFFPWGSSVHRKISKDCIVKGWFRNPRK